jgi:hypothetical protein
MREYGVTDKMAVSVARNMTSFSDDGECATSIDLHGNSIHDEGATALAAALKANSRIQVLDLSANGVGTAGGCALALAVQQGCGLRVLDLSGNNVGNRTAIALGAARARSQCRFVPPLIRYTGFTKIIGTSNSEPTMRRNPRRGVRAQAARHQQGGPGQGAALPLARERRPRADRAARARRRARGQRERAGIYGVCFVMLRVLYPARA